MKITVTETYDYFVTRTVDLPAGKTDGDIVEIVDNVITFKDGTTFEYEASEVEGVFGDITHTTWETEEDC